MGTVGQPRVQARALLVVQPATTIGQALAQRARQLFVAGAQGRQSDLAVIVGHRLEADRQQRLQRLAVRHGDVGTHVQRGRNPQHLGQTNGLQHPDHAPANIELEPPQRELGRAGECVVVVVQLLTADPECPRGQVGGFVAGLEVAIAPPVAQAVHHTGRPQRNPQHLDRPDRDAGKAEQTEADEQQQRRAECRVRRVDVALDPVVRTALAVLLDRRAVAAGFPVQLHATPEDVADALGERAMRILFGLAGRMMLAMDRHPLAGDHRGGQPRPETEEMVDDRVELHTAMGHRAVQVQGDGKNGQLGGDQQIDDQRAKAGLQQATGEEVEHESGHFSTPVKGTGRMPGQSGRRSTAESIMMPRGCDPVHS